MSDGVIEEKYDRLKGALAWPWLPVMRFIHWSCRTWGKRI